jgi:hypothetical protein
MLAKRNVDRSGGPRAAAGKRRSRLNAHKHGLSIPVTADQYLSKTAADLAKFMAGERADDAMFAQGLIIAECELTLRRIRQAKVTAIETARVQTDQKTGVADDITANFIAALPILSSIERYERRTLSRRKKALQTLSDLQLMAQLRRELGSE